MKIEDYTIIRAISTTELENAVLKSISAHGWTPIGGVLFAEDYYHQAMIKTTEEL